MTTGFKIKTNHQCISKHYPPNFPGGVPEEWYEEWDFDTILSCKIHTEQGSAPDAISAERIVPGDTVYVVTCVSSSGDSFGMAKNNEIHFQYVTKDKAYAQRIVDNINQHAKADEGKPLLMPLPRGHVAHTLETPWVYDWFVQLESAGYHTIVVT